jgi:hypothetical protein
MMDIKEEIEKIIEKGIFLMKGRIWRKVRKRLNKVFN